jgi:hypothetical protein
LLGDVPRRGLRNAEAVLARTRIGASARALRNLSSGAMHHAL